MLWLDETLHALFVQKLGRLQFVIEVTDFPQLFIAIEFLVDVLSVPSVFEGLFDDNFGRLILALILAYETNLEEDPLDDVKAPNELTQKPAVIQKDERLDPLFESYESQGAYLK